MSEQLLTILKFALLALLYLFFLRVLRAVWAEIRGPRVSTRRQQAAAVSQVAPSKKARKSGEPHLLVVEPVAQRGRDLSAGPGADRRPGRRVSGDPGRHLCVPTPCQGVRP